MTPIKTGPHLNASGAALSQNRLPGRAGAIYSPIILALALRFMSAPTASASYLVLAGFALLGRQQTVLALAFSWLFSMVNPGLAPEAAGAGRYLVILAAAASALFHSGFGFRHLRVHTFTLATMLLCGFLILHSITFSPMPDVSVLKAASWGLAMSALVSSWLGLTPQELDMTSRRLFLVLTLLAIASLPLLSLPQGYLRNGYGFQGVLNHPQAFGSFAALLGAWAGARMFGEQRPSLFLMAVTGLCLALVVLSEARTGGLAMVLGLVLSLLLSPVFAGRKLLHMVPGLASGRVWLALGAMITSGIAMAPAISDLIDRFMTKSHRASVSGLLDAYDTSRGFLIDQMIANITTTPFRGIGFGIASHPNLMIVERDPVFNLPLSAAIEKGTMPLAVLEEIGVMGACLVAGWLFWLLRNGNRAGLAPFAVCLTILALNMGENTLFSTGGQGMLALIFLSWVFATAEMRRHDNQAQATPSLRDCGNHPVKPWTTGIKNVH